MKGTGKGCTETEDPPFPEGAITLEDMKEACRDYDPIESYPLAVDNFRKARGISSPDAQSEADIDLCEEQQVQQLVAMFLNPWQCRLPNPESKVITPEKRPVVLGRFEKMTHGLHDWWERYAEVLPSVKVRLPTVADDEIERCLELFEALCDVRVADEVNYKGKCFGDVAASKTLHILRPQSARVTMARGE